MHFFETFVEEQFKHSPYRDKLKNAALNLYTSYAKETAHTLSSEERDKIFVWFIQLVERQISHPYPFSSYHERLSSPIDYTRFGLEITRPLIDFAHSFYRSEEVLRSISSWLQQGQNVVLLANHQTELDPQILGVLLEKEYPQIVERMVFVAGQKVLTNPMAVPFSLGCNLLCIHSKKYLDQDPSTKMQKQLHNQRTMKIMRDLLQKGGQCIYVAPSGGRDRLDGQTGKIELAPFDPGSIEMLRLMAVQAHTPTHFIPLALYTMRVLAPPVKGASEEPMVMRYSKVGLSFGSEIDMNETLAENKHIQRERLAGKIFAIISADYDNLTVALKQPEILP